MAQRCSGRNLVQFVLLVQFYAATAAPVSGSKPILLRRLLPHYTIVPEKTPDISPCNFYGVPQPKLLWIREGQSLSSSSTDGPYYTPDSDGVLVLRHAKAADSGNYTCFGFNIWGNSSASTIITIIEKVNFKKVIVDHKMLHQKGPLSTGHDLGLIFLYVLLVWLLLSTLLAVYMISYGRTRCSGQTNNDHRTSIISTDSHAFPSEWDDQTERLKIVEISQSSSEWRTVESRFKATLSNANITKILRIQNKMLWKSYMQEKARIVDKNKENANEKQLFHGTRKNDPLLIYNGEEGFEMRLSCGGMWGQANYFAVNASYSDNYAFIKDGVRVIFLARVLTGDSCKMDPNKNLCIPPVKPRPPINLNGIRSSLSIARKRYDTVNGLTNGSEVYMTYDNRKSYPAYLIHYRK